MHKLNIYISPLYIIASFFMIYFGAFDVFCYYLIALWIHEFGHYIVSKRLGYMLNNIDIMPYGASMSGNTNYKNNTHKFMVTVAGPIFNFMLALIIVAIWWVYPNTYAYTHILLEANLYIGIFNLIPLFPFDGGQALLSIINKSKRILVYRIMKVIGMIISVLYMSLFISSIFAVPNFTLLCVSIFMFIMSIESYNIDYINSANNLNTIFDNVIEHKLYIVRSDINFINLVKYFSSNYYVQFQFVNDSFEVIDTMNQSQILKDIESGKYFLK